MIRGIDGKPYVDLDRFLDIEGFKNLHPEICKGFALAKNFAKEGTWMKPAFNFDDSSYIVNWKPIYKAFEEFEKLDKNDPVKKAGLELWPKDFKNFEERNTFLVFLKSALGAHDPYSYYFLWEDASNMSDRGESQHKKTYESQFFPNVTKWVENLKTINIVESVGRVIFFVSNSSCQPFEHRDIDYSTQGDENGYSNHNIEFIHIRPFLKRGFYIWNPTTKNKSYVNSHACFFNDQDWHGGEFSMEQEYGLRIDCKFTTDFKEKIGIDHLEHY